MQQKVDSRQFRVKESIENCIVELQAIGASRDTALSLLLIQSFIRMTDKGQREAKAFVDDAMTAIGEDG
jgi:hypothetical protein